MDLISGGQMPKLIGVPSLPVWTGCGFDPDEDAGVDKEVCSQTHQLKCRGLGELRTVCLWNSLGFYASKILCLTKLYSRASELSSQRPCLVGGLPWPSVCCWSLTRILLSHFTRISHLCSLAILNFWSGVSSAIQFSQNPSFSPGCFFPVNFHPLKPPPHIHIHTHMPYSLGRYEFPLFLDSELHFSLIL